MKSIGVIGSGGREHAICWKLAQSLPTQNIYALPGNGGTHNNVQVNIDNFDDVLRTCNDLNIDLVVVGPEAPLAAGMADYLDSMGLPVFGPTRKAARLESSKLWAKDFMVRNGVKTPRHWRFDSAAEARGLLEELHGDAVIKFDGLAGGKGVYVCWDIHSARAALQDLAARYGDKASFLVEERLDGQEVSILGFTDGESIRLLSPSQDHKQLYDGDSGPNTGGMGAFCPVPQLDSALLRSIREDIVQPTIAGLQAESLDYRGVIYFGLMITRSGPQLLEYNVRLGDPEAEVLLPALKSDLVQLLEATVERRLHEVSLEFHPGYFVDVVLTSRGYPANYETGHRITGLERLSDDALVFHGGTRNTEHGLLTSGGRVLNIVARGATLDEAIRRAYLEVDKVHFDGMNCRTDIGRREWNV